MKNYHLKAFSLAEFLIILGIVGVIGVASMTTIQNTKNNKQYEADFKKSLEIFNNVTTFLKLNNGGNISGIFRNSDNAINGFCEKLDCRKICHTSDDKTNCFHSTNWYNLNGKAGWQDFSTLSYSSSAVLSNGMSFNLMWNKNCNIEDGFINICGALTIDTNGEKEPNQMGRDMFEILIDSSNIIPAGAHGTTWSYAKHPERCNPSLTSEIFNGSNCAGRILQEGGMKY